MRIIEVMHAYNNAFLNPDASNVLKNAFLLYDLRSDDIFFTHRQPASTHLSKIRV